MRTIISFVIVLLSTTSILAYNDALSHQTEKLLVTVEGLNKAPALDCPGVDDPLNPIRYPHETDCTKYYECVAGQVISMTCGNGQQLSPIRRECMAPNVAGCDRCPDVDVVEETVRLPHETMCRFYYVCENGNTQISQCIFDTLFSRAERACLDPPEAQCLLPNV